VCLGLPRACFPPGVSRATGSILLLRKAFSHLACEFSLTGRVLWPCVPCNLLSLSHMRTHTEHEVAAAAAA
jgi:hypothetical protein